MIKKRLKKQVNCFKEEIRYCIKCGGRGASSNIAKGQSIFKGQSSRGADKTKVLPNAQANVRIKVKTEQEALNWFTKQYKNAPIEHGFEIDANGFVNQNLVGNSSSVGLGATNKKAGITIHNHPMSKGQKDYSHFSGTDLRTFSANPNERTMYVVSNKATYKITKDSRWFSKQERKNGRLNAEFQKALNNAKSPSATSYDKAVSKFLKDNAKKFHYTYTETK